MLEQHLASRQVTHVIYGAIIGLALIVALEEHPPRAGVVAVSLLSTAVAVGLAELYSAYLGEEMRARRHVRRDELRHMLHNAGAVMLGVSMPAVFFALAAIGVFDDEAAFTTAKWSGVGLITAYGYGAAHLAGESTAASAMRALAAGLIAMLLIGLKALVH
jgi:hypothetical protein